MMQAQRYAAARDALDSLPLPVHQTVTLLC